MSDHDHCGDEPRDNPRDGSRDEAPDEVDRLVRAWVRERPDLDLSPLEVLSRVSRLAHHLDGLRRQSFAAHGLEAWEFDVLAALRRAGEPYALSPGRLLRETLVTSGTMTNRIDRLATRGLVARGPDPADRRGVVVTLLSDGRRAVDAAFTTLLGHEHTLLAQLAPPERRVLADLLRSALRDFEAV